MYVYNVNPSLRNYTVVGLEPYTSYNFSVQAISDEYLPSEFSLENIITTTAEGKLSVGNHFGNNCMIQLYLYMYIV